MFVSKETGESIDPEKLDMVNTFPTQVPKGMNST